MRIAMTVGNFSPGEADELRRSMGAWKISGAIHKFEEKLRAGMKRNGIHDSFATEIYNQIQGFSEYGFPESHAISFAHLAYASAWLKAHFPSYFLLGLLNSQPLGFYSTHSLLQEARQAGVRILPPCLLFSDWDHTITDTPQERNTSTAQLHPCGVIRLGLRLVHGIQCEQAAAFISARKDWLDQHAPNRGHLSVWRSSALEMTLDSFLNLMAAHFESRSCLQLITGGLLDAFSRDRRMLLWHLLGGPGELLPDLKLRAFAAEDSNELPWQAEYGDVHDDCTVLGTSLRAHPLHFIKKWMWPFPVPVERITTAIALGQQQVKEGSLVHVCGLVTIKQAPPTAKGMIFVTIEDETGNINLTLTPQIATRYRSELTADQSGLFCASGIVQGPGFGHSLRVRHIYASRKNPRTTNVPNKGRAEPPRPAAEDDHHNETQPALALAHGAPHIVDLSRHSVSLFPDPALWQKEQQ
jgi:error-prone DNA polymerase